MDTGDKYMFDEAGGQWIKLGSGGGGDTGEVWLVGDTGVEQGGMTQFALRNIDETDHMTELYNNADAYNVFANGVELPYLTQQEYGNIWMDSESFEQATVGLNVSMNGGDISATATYLTSPAPDSVEVSVKAK